MHLLMAEWATEVRMWDMRFYKVCAPHFEKKEPGELFESLEVEPKPEEDSTEPESDDPFDELDEDGDTQSARTIYDNISRSVVDPKDQFEE